MSARYVITTSEDNHTLGFSLRYARVNTKHALGTDELHTNQALGIDDVSHDSYHRHRPRYEIILITKK